MKKLLCMILVVALIASLLTISTLETAAESGGKGTLTVTCHGQVLGEVEVGNEFIYRVSMNSGGYAVMGCNAQVRYNSDYAQIVEYGEVDKDGEINMNAYSFPTRIRNSNLISNFFGVKDEINYNFSKYVGTGVYRDEDHYFKVRFKAVAPGTVEIRHYIYSCYWMNSTKYIRLFHNDKGDDQLDPIPYTLCSIEPATALIGDADGDYQLTVMDATFIQRVTAGTGESYPPVNADVNTDGSVNLRDALNILRYKAGMLQDTDIGTWIFDSEIDDAS